MTDFKPIKRRRHSPEFKAQHARTFLGKWRGSLVCDDYAGYKAGFVSGITEAGCMAHSRRKFFDLHVSSKSQIAGQACAYISQLYEVEREVKHLGADERLQMGVSGFLCAKRLNVS